MQPIATRPSSPLHFVHPSSTWTSCRNGTIGLEILEDLPDVNSVLVPYGGGGLSCGIATAVTEPFAPRSGSMAARSLRPAPLSRGAHGGRPGACPRTRHVRRRDRGSGAAAGDVAARIAPAGGSLVVRLPEVAAVHPPPGPARRVVAEGAAAPRWRPRSRVSPDQVVRWLSSQRNIDPEVLTTILSG